MDDLRCKPLRIKQLTSVLMEAGSTLRPSLFFLFEKERRRTSRLVHVHGVMVNRVRTEEQEEVRWSDDRRSRGFSSL